MSLDESSDTDLFHRWESGDGQAGEELFRRYLEMLCRRAEQLMSDRLARRYGPEDAAQSALGSFLRRAEQGQYHVDHSGALWRLLETILRHKIARQGSKLHGEVPLPTDVLARGPSHEEVLAVADSIEAALQGMKPDAIEICRLRCAGYLTREIVAQLGCSRWTVRRAIKRFTDRLTEQLLADEDREG